MLFRLPSAPVALVLAAAAGALVQAEQACNNSPDLCGRAYNDIVHMGAHDSPFVRDESTQNSVAGNQYYNATVALDAGIRLLQGQVHNVNGALHLCHSDCGLLDAGLLADWLRRVRVWLDGHPDDVVTVLLVNSDGDDAAAYGQAFTQSGLAKYGYAPNATRTAGNGWPTLGDMIEADTRLVALVAELGQPSADFPYLLDEFEHVFETAFEVVTPAGFNCSLHRPAGGGTASSAAAAGMLPLVNHFLDQSLGGGLVIPDADAAGDTNSADKAKAGALGLHARTCAGEFGVKPTFVLVDFFDQGPALDTADALNGVSNAVGRKAVGSGGQGQSAGNAGNADRFEMGTVALLAFIAASLLMV